MQPPDPASSSFNNLFLLLSVAVSVILGCTTNFSPEVPVISKKEWDMYKPGGTHRGIMSKWAPNAIWKERNRMNCACFRDHPGKAKYLDKSKPDLLSYASFKWLIICRSSRGLLQVWGGQGPWWASRGLWHKNQRMQWDKVKCSHQLKIQTKNHFDSVNMFCRFLQCVIKFHFQL